jgi:hypothetical protein
MGPRGAQEVGQEEAHEGRESCGWRLGRKKKMKKKKTKKEVPGDPRGARKGAIQHQGGPGRGTEGAISALEKEWGPQRRLRGAQDGSH